ncbi:inositol monophosphatase family protein [Radiobacillus sp. PE A8.2]|uniref:inositol monophosphatase family protein n=1 Tax=Radiobacillus sp. PE A8.2 TaxID=3380349 RepID=UPI00388FD1DB
MESSSELYRLAKQWVLEAGEQLRKTMDGSLTITYKTSAADIVTQKDVEIETFFADRLRSAFPSHYLLGEEGASHNKEFDPADETVWIIDPIDGTTNFVHLGRIFCISLAVYQKGKPLIGIVYDPIADELFHAMVGSGAYLNDNKLDELTETTIEESVISINQLWTVPNNKVDNKKLHKLVQDVRGTRYFGSAALEMAYVACGRLDSYFDFRLSTWDMAGAMVILAEVNAEMSTINRQPIELFSPSTTVFSRPSLHNKLLDYIN